MTIQKRLQQLETQVELLAIQRNTQQAELLEYRAWKESKGLYEEYKKEYIADHKNEWKATGAKYQRLRELLFLTRSSVAYEMGIGHNTLKKFEEGQPVQRAKFIAQAYENYLRIMTERTIPDVPPHMQKLLDGALREIDGGFGILEPLKHWVERYLANVS